jgi:hypothetical protein
MSAAVDTRTGPLSDSRMLETPVALPSSLAASALVALLLALAPGCDGEGAPAKDGGGAAMIDDAVVMDGARVDGPATGTDGPAVVLDAADTASRDTAETPFAHDGSPAAEAADAAATADAGDARGFPDAATTFLARLYDGVWLVGWSGDLLHYSWVRFIPGGDGMGGSWATAPAMCKGCTTFIHATGGGNGCDGTFSVALPSSVILGLAPGCVFGTGSSIAEWDFSSFAPSDRPGAIERASIRSIAPTTIEGYRYPASHCGAALSSCPALTGF